MDFMNDDLNSHLSSVFKPKNPDFIPDCLFLSYKKTTSKLWEEIGKEILTPFAPKFNLYDYGKYLPESKAVQRKGRPRLTQLSSYYSRESIISNGDTIITPRSPINYPSSEIISRNFLNKSNGFEKITPLKSKKKIFSFLKEKCFEKIILKKAHSINLEKPIDFFEEEEMNYKVIGEKNQEGGKSSFKGTVDKIKAVNIFRKQVKDQKLTKEIFRRKSCHCSQCGTSEKLAKILTIFVKINNSSNVIRNQPNFIKTLKIPSLKSEEFLNIIANTKPEKRISNINIINNYTSEEIPPIVKIKKSKPKILQTSNISKATHPINPNPKNHSPINPRQNTQSKQNNHFILNKYKKPERNFDKSLYLDHQERKLSNKVCIKTDRNNNYSTNCDNTTNRIQNITLNVEKSRDLSEIIFNNGSLRTKQLIQRELKGFSIISPRKLLSNPYIEKKMNMLIKSIWKKK